MGIIIRTAEGPTEISDSEIRAAADAFPDVDVLGELERFASWIAVSAKREPRGSALANAINGWLRRARPRPARAFPTPEHRSERVRHALEECIRRGLVPPGFEPTGQDDGERLNSLRARATCEWYRRFPGAASDQVPLSQRLLWEPQQTELAV